MVWHQYVYKTKIKKKQQLELVKFFITGNSARTTTKLVQQSFSKI
jgi:hypothetical protein